MLLPEMMASLTMLLFLALLFCAFGDEKWLRAEILASAMLRNIGCMW